MNLDANLFVSHKHSDRAIAEVFAQFVKEKTAGGVKVYVSSSPAFEGPRAGKNINDQLKDALARTDVVVLIYTSEDNDWQYCMWECGLAIDPADERPTHVVVLQCGEAAPKPFADELRVMASDLDSITMFIQELLTGDDFFPRAGTRIVDFNPEDPAIGKYAIELKDALATVVPASLAGAPTDLTSSAFLRIELPEEAVDQIPSITDLSYDDIVRRVLREHGTIVESDLTTQLFGFAITALTTVDQVLIKSQQVGGEEDPVWFKSLARQIGLAARQRYPEGIAFAPYRVEGGKSLIPYVTRSRKFEPDGRMQFDTYFVPLSPAPVLATSRMVTTDQAFHERLDKTPASKIGLAKLKTEMAAGERSRVPVLGEGNKPRYIIHLSMIDKYISDLSISGKDVTSLTLADLLAVEEMEQLFSSTYAVVGPEVTMADAKGAMGAVEDCRDVFITQDGTKASAVLGWLTNVSFI